MDCKICGCEIDKQVDPMTGEVIWSQGHNAEPVVEGRCCSDCNEEIVIPARIGQLVEMGVLEVVDDGEEHTYH